MLPYSQMAGGNFTLANTTTPVDVKCISQNPPDFIWLRNRTAWGTGAAPTQNVEYTWSNGMNQGTAKALNQTTSTLALTSASLAADGISTYDTTNPPTFPPVTSTGIVDTTGVVTMTNSVGANGFLISVGDIVRIYNAVGMQEISGMDFQVTATTSTTSITLGQLAGITGANATAAQVLKFIPSRFYPRWRWITSITQANQAVINFSVAHDFTPGEFIGLRIGKAFGMQIPLHLQDVRVLSTTTFSVTVDLNTVGFVPFAYPTNATALMGMQIAQAVPSASGVVPFMGSATIPQSPPGTNLLDAFDNRNTRVIHFGSTMFASATTADIWDWKAFKFDQFNGN